MYYVYIYMYIYIHIYVLSHSSALPSKGTMDLQGSRGAVLALPGLKGLLRQWVEEGEVGGVASFQDWFKASGCFDSHSLADRVRSESAVQHPGCDRKDAVVTAEFFLRYRAQGCLAPSSP